MKNVAISLIVLIAVVILAFYAAQTFNNSNANNMTFELDNNEIRCYTMGFANIDTRLHLSNDSWNQSLLISKAKCQYYNGVENYPYQIEAIGSVSNETPNYASSFYAEPHLKNVYFYGLYSLEYSEECLTVGGKTIFPQIWRGGKYEPPENESRVTEGTARCRWLCNREVGSTLDGLV